MEHLQALLQQKTSLESHLRTLDQTLAENSATRTSALVDQEGFPRADLDIHTIVHTRRELNRAQNDLRALMQQIEQALHVVHQQGTGTLEEEKKKKREEEESSVRERGFARVESVAVGGPAQEAGMQAGDVVVRVGQTHVFAQVAQEVTKSRDGEIQFTVDRIVDGAPQRMHLLVRPRLGWGGRGLLGCHLIELPSA
ncbi:putative 26S proteasome regulatory subunit [Coemansia sp. RSA 2703]|nr:putative 26S proteasome regulatory subunit [Coemansia sp. RSA 2703]KAJ2367674.1 putative 26S proteasome regulatory subunit [Coemansia sp. RSA 2607]KAJ2380220.1 putative 26S proteasome regulatory subunit [Coemansia sp. RSA 2603]